MAAPADAAEDETIVFENVTALYRSLDELQDKDFLVVTDVSASDFELIDQERERRALGTRFFFQGDKQELRITRPSPPHERMHGNLYQAIIVAMYQPPAMPPWASAAASWYHHPNGTGGRKEGDSGGFPFRRDSGGGDARWPSLVIECGMSQSVASLHAAMRWWFSASENRVKIVLVVKLYQSNHAILIEKFTQEQAVNDHSGATTTTRSTNSNMRMMEPVLRQAITITPVPDSTPVRYNVTSSPLVLEFELLHRRARGLGPGERDCIISEETLEGVASQVWDD